jgi:hypothetical protein
MMRLVTVAPLPELGLSCVTEESLAAVAAERVRQHALWGQQSLPDGTGVSDAAANPWSAITSLGPLEVRDRLHVEKAPLKDRRSGHSTWAGVLLEEVAEAMAEDDQARLARHLAEVAAVAVQWMEDVKLRSCFAAVNELPF